MKALSIVLAVVAACLLALIAVFWFGGALEAEVAIAPAVTGEEALDAVEDAQNGLALHTYASIDETRDCALTDITVTFANSGLFDAEWLTCSLVPGAGDVALYAQSDIKLDVEARSQAQLTLRVLTQGDGAGRALDVEYYVLGMRRTMTVPLDG